MSILIITKEKILESKVRTKPQKTNMIDEYFDLSKILNEEERIQALNDELKRRIEAKELKNAKLSNSQNSKQSKKKKSDERTHS